MKISICAATYKRPLLLEKMLQSLADLTFKKIIPPTVEVIVVDNDSTKSAEPVIQKLQPLFRWPLKYYMEPQQGVTYARNRSIAEARSDSEFIVMLDDDEVATPSWLEELILIQKLYDADIVSGPVLPIYLTDVKVPAWIKDGDFYTPPRFNTGHELMKAFTGNVLFRTQLTQDANESKPFFDNRFARNGGEDTYLFMCLHKEGRRIIWANDAVLYEPVAAQRMTLSWLLKRNFWGWNIYSQVEKELYPSLKKKGLSIIKSCALILLGAALLPPALLQGKRKGAEALINIVRGFGKISGLFGYRAHWQ